MSAVATADPGLEIERLSRRYGDVVALQDMSFQVHPGELFGFVGPNGAGKTTTMRIVLGVLAADSGEVRWAGAPITFETRRRIGYMPEERGLYPKMKVLEQLVYLAGLHGMPAAAATRAAETWLDRLGLAGRRQDQVQKLSQGNQQRVQLAAALLFEPEVLVLDEPFSGLDPVAVDVMSEVLREQANAGIPVVFSSHQLDLVERLCDRVGIIRAGRMVACGAVDELRRSGAERLWVDAPQAQDGWAQRVPGVNVLRTEGSRALVQLDPTADDQMVLRAALETGPITGFVLYLSLVLYGTFIAQGVVEEKTSRVVEILLSTVRPSQLLFGKVVGIGLVGLFQLAIVGAAGLILTVPTHVLAVPTLAVGAVAGALLWFVLGFVMYGLLFAAAGSLVSRQEEVGLVTMPITMLLLAAWFIALGVVLPQMSGNPTSLTSALLSLLPPFAPLLMSGRMAAGDAPVWQVLLAVALTLVTTGALTWLAARIYANSVLRTGARIKLSEALRGV